MCEAESDDKKCFFLFHVTLELFTLPVLIYLEVEEHDARVLHRALDGPQEGDSLSSVNESMVVGESDVHHGLAHHLRGKNRSDSFLLHETVKQRYLLGRCAPPASQKSRASRGWPIAEG